MSLTTKRHQRPRPDRTGGVAGNERLTAWTGVVLLIGFAVEGITVLRIGQLLTLHFLVGLLLIGPVILKVASTGYRITRYYAGSAPYVRRGPPAPYLRLLGPLVIATSVAVLGTGLTLGIVGPDNGPWLPIVVGGSALLIAAGYFLGRYYVQLHAQTPTDRFLHDLEGWVDERSEGLPRTVRDKLNATVGFLSTSLRNTPINQIVTRIQNKPRRLFNLF